MSDQRRQQIGQRLAAAIRRAGTSQGRLANALGVSRGTMSSWAKGRYQPPLETLADACRLLGVSADELLGLQPTKARLDTARLTARCNQLEKRMRDDLAALRAEIERLKG